MAKIVFYEKPGCINNTKQKALLSAAGHQVEARNLLTTPWTPELLRSYFGSRPVPEWFNASAPRIKSGEVVPSELDEATALALMVLDPLLIRRPLIQVGDACQVGFDRDTIDAWIGLSPAACGERSRTAPALGDLENCPRAHETATCQPPTA